MEMQINRGYVVGRAGAWVLVSVSGEIVAVRAPGDRMVRMVDGSVLLEGLVEEAARELGIQLQAPPKELPIDVERWLHENAGRDRRVRARVEGSPASVVEPPVAPARNSRLERRRRLEAFVESVGGRYEICGERVILSIPDQRGDIGCIQVSLDGSVQPWLGRETGIAQRSRSDWLVRRYGSVLRRVVIGDGVVDD